MPRSKTRTKVFLGYAVFHMGTPLPCSLNTVTRDKLYLKAHGLFKLNRLDRFRVQHYSGCSAVIERRWKGCGELTLRRVYAEA